MNEQITGIIGVYLLAYLLVYSYHKGEKYYTWLLLAAFTMFLISGAGYIMNSFWYSTSARPGTLYSGSTYLVIGKAAYLTGIAVELTKIAAYHLVDSRDPLTNKKLSGYIVQILSLFILALGIHYYPDPLVKFLGDTGADLDPSDVRSLLIPVLTAVISSRFIEATYDFIAQFNPNNAAE